MAKLKDTYNLLAVHPGIAEQWHPVKNGNLTPKKVKPYSGIKVWWVCSKGHEWEAVIDNRTKLGNNCPFCSNRRVYEKNCLQTINPKLAKQWHPVKNGDLTPKEVPPYSNKKVWWQCSKGHEWQAAISNRSRGRGCPYCSGMSVCRDNCLETVNPSVAKQWHPFRNGILTPRDITANSGKKVWWQCKKGHEWQTTVASRNNGTGCPKCRTRKKKTQGT